MGLLAVDLGFKAGFALYNDEGRLVSFSSQHFANRATFKRAIWGIVERAGELEMIVVEGDKDLGGLWRKVAEKRDISFLSVQAQDWRAPE